MKDAEARHKETTEKYEKEIEKLRSEGTTLHLELERINQANTQLAGHK